ncbi:MAG: RluA family pseudouridine synthase [Candidatus Kryptoniota bacterium]
MTRTREMFREVELFVAPGQKNKERIDRFLVKQVEGLTRAKVQKLISAAMVLVNGVKVKPSYRISPGDKIVVRIMTTAPQNKAIPENIPLDIVYEDEFLIVVNKPAGMVTHPGHGNWTGTLVNALLYHCNKLSSLNDASIRPGIVHRLDKDTSGLILAAKDDDTHSSLARQFSDRTIRREYWAIVWGKMPDTQGVIEAGIGRSKSDRKKFSVVEGGKFALTEYKVLKEFEYLSLVQLKLKTGRTHQIRVHLSHVGNPVFGDPVYHGRRISQVEVTSRIKNEVTNLLRLISRQALHAKTIGFRHPASNQMMFFDSELPADFKNVLKHLEM